MFGLSSQGRDFAACAKAGVVNAVNTPASQSILVVDFIKVLN